VGAADLDDPLERLAPAPQRGMQVLERGQQLVLDLLDCKTLLSRMESPPINFN
jgi:hypothetical protein